MLPTLRAALTILVPTLFFLFLSIIQTAYLSLSNASTACLILKILVFFAQAKAEAFLVCLKKFHHAINEKVAYHFQKAFSVWCIQLNKLWLPDFKCFTTCF